MSASEITRQAIITSTKALACSKPFQKVSVTEIVQRCGINRNTFYYYFTDKYDVITSIFNQELLPILETEKSSRSLAENVTALCARMHREQGLYESLLADTGSRCFQTLLVDYYKGFLIGLAADRFEAFRVAGRDQEIAARFYAHGTVGMICDWAARDMRMDSAFATEIIQLSAREKFFV